MNKVDTGTSLADFDAVRLMVASSQDVLDWSHGEVTKPETINYRTQKPERDGLFCEKIFGPVKDINRHDNKFKGVRSREVAVDKDGDIVTKSIVRRERMGHIKLAAPVTHIWFLRGAPSPLGLIMGMTVKNLEKVVYFACYMIVGIEEDKLVTLGEDAEAQHEAAKKAIKARYEDMAEEENADVKKLAAEQTKELEEEAERFVEWRDKLNTLVKGALIGEGDYRELDPSMKQHIKVMMGAPAIEKMLKDIDLDKMIEELTAEAEESKGQKLKKLIKRLKVLENMRQAGIKPESLIMNAVPVIPPDLRPMVQLTGGRFATSDLNDLYRRVINRNNRLKKLVDLRAPEVIKRNEMRMLQEAVDALIDNNNARSGRAVSATGGRRKLKSLSDQLKGKQGRFRQNLLGKRVDYSGRSVIVSGPELKLNQCGMPKMMALELFKPYVISNLIEEDYAHNIKSATRLIESGTTAVWDALDRAIEGKYVLLNRAPTLHRLGIQAFQPILIEGKAMQLHPLVCKGFNADFDGDQMAVHLPLSIASQKEARELMAADKNLLKPADGTSILSLEYDIVLGCFYITNDTDEKGEYLPYESVNAVIKAYHAGQIDIQQRVSVRINSDDESRTDTTLGRLLFNEVLPEGYPYQNSPATKKSLKTLMADVYSLYGQEVTGRVADQLKTLGFEYATQSGVSVGMDDYQSLDGLDKILAKGEDKLEKIAEQYDNGLITNDERYRLTVENWRSVNDTVLDSLSDQFDKDNTSATSITIKSGARGNIDNLRQMAAWIGVLADASGKEIELPIKSSYKDGLSPLESFTSTRGTRKGMISTALRTADSGYLTRRLVDVAQDIFTVEEEHEDPGRPITRAESTDIGLEFADRIAGRYAAVAVKDGSKNIVKKGEAITPELAAEIDNSSVDEVRIMSVLSCSNLRGVSQKSYGFDLATRSLVEPDQPIGVIAAQSIGEPGTQLTLDVFHAGGVAGDDISQGLPRVEEIFEARQPKGKAFMSDIDGKVSVWEVGETYVAQVNPSDANSKAQSTDGYKPSVKSGTIVAKGDTIAKPEEGKKKPLTAPMDGTVDVFDNEIVVTEGAKRTMRYEIPGFKQLLVKDGDTVNKGGRLTNGSLDLRELMGLKGLEATQNYIMNEVIRIFAAQGQNIDDKHLEVIVRQMFSRVQVEDSGDTEFATGDIVSKASMVEVNDEMVKAGKEPAQYTQLLLGITKVSTWSDSFLSAASFQDTTRVLINAAISGKVDNLYGLKENVIIGRKIPVGTGVQDDDDEDDGDEDNTTGVDL